jgi:hypothetical protein
MKGPERPCSIKPQQTSSRNVLPRPVEPAAQSGRSRERVENYPVSNRQGDRKTLSAHARAGRFCPNLSLAKRPPWMSAIGGRAENICSFRVFLSLTQTGHGVTTDKIVSAARPHKSTIRLMEGLRAQRFGLRPRMWSKPCLIAAKRASIIGSNSRSVKIYGQSFSTPSRTSSPT